MKSDISVKTGIKLCDEREKRIIALKTAGSSINHINGASLLLDRVRKERDRYAMMIGKGKQRGK